MGARCWAPGLECADPREMHNHCCAMCGDITLWSRVACQAMDYVPPCGVCRSKLWLVTEHPSHPAHEGGPLP